MWDERLVESLTHGAVASISEEQDEDGTRSAGEGGLVPVGECLIVVTGRITGSSRGARVNG